MFPSLGATGVEQPTNVVVNSESPKQERRGIQERWHHLMPNTRRSFLGEKIKSCSVHARECWEI